MNQNVTETRFLPAERCPIEEVRGQRKIVESIPLLRETLDAMPQFVLIMNECRQILFANRAVARALGKSLDEIAGQRFGEALGCIRAQLEEGGCGTSEYCTVCGAGRAMLSMLKGSQVDERVCRMIVKEPGTDLDLVVRTTAMSVSGLSFIMFVASDRSGETRRRLLEKLFFHDALNTAGVVNGIAELLPDAGSKFPTYCRLLRTSSEQLLEQILSQRELASIESGEYELKPSRCEAAPFLEAMVSLFSAHPAAEGRILRVAPHLPGVAIVTDRGLLMRVVGNMLKNAVEAEPRGTVVPLGCDARADGGVEIWVRNPTVMPRQVQLQLFQRAFSTKGPERGLGTYSMRLLTERYLGGTVSFRSESGRGTEFRIALPSAIARPPMPEREAL